MLGPYLCTCPGTFVFDMKIEFASLTHQSRDLEIFRSATSCEITIDHMWAVMLQNMYRPTKFRHFMMDLLSSDTEYQIDLHLTNAYSTLTSSKHRQQRCPHQMRTITTPHLTPSDDCRRQRSRNTLDNPFHCIYAASLTCPRPQQEYPSLHAWHWKRVSANKKHLRTYISISLTSTLPIDFNDNTSLQILRRTSTFQARSGH